MFLMFARFNFVSADLAAEDKNYFDHHVPLARRLPGVRMYLTGKLLETPNRKPDRYRAVLFGYDTPQAGLSSLDCPTGVELMADSAGHIAGTIVDACEGHVLVPFEARRPGMPCLVAALRYNVNPSVDDGRLRSHQASIHNLPRLCGYVTGATFAARGERPDRNWMEIRIFQSPELRQSLSELIAIDQSIALDPLIYCFEGEVQL
jgi:hypothetical protein